MKMRSYVLAVLLLAFAMPVMSQQFTNRGKEFWAGFGHHTIMEWENPITQVEMTLYFSAEEAAHVVVTIAGTAYREEYDVPANSVVRSKKIPRGLKSVPTSPYDARLYTKPSSFGGTDSEGLFTSKGIHIESNVPIVAYAHVFSQASSAATMLIPVEAWGYSYRALTVKQTITPNTDGFMDRFSWLFVIASENNTKVRITPSVRTRGGKPANVPIDVTLQKGEVYQLLGGYNSTTDLFSVSGSTVQSIANDQGECHPVSAFVGASGVHVSCPGFVGRYPPEENIVQQMFPVQAWGKRYLTTPTSYSEEPKIQNNNLFLVSVKDPATVVKRNGVVLTGLNNLTYEYYSNTSDYIEADQPICVAQAIPSTGACNYMGKGDPELMYISPIEQGIKQTGFFLNKDYAVDWNFVSLTIPTAGLASLTIDGSKTFSYTFPHPNLPGYSVVVNRWRSTIIKGQCHIKSDSAFTGITYGLGEAETYGYNIGAYINNLSGIPEIKNTYNTADTANLYTCVNTPVKLSVLMRYKPTKLQWKLSQMAGVITPAQDVTDLSPVPIAEVDWKGVTYYRYTLPVEYRFLVGGKHLVPVYATHPTVEGCDHTEKIQYEVEVRAALKTDFNILYENCNQKELINFEADPTYTDGTAVRQWLWTFTGTPAPVSYSGQKVNHEFTAGQYNAQLIAVDDNACIADTSKIFTLSANPLLPEIETVPAELCEGTQVTIKEKTPQAGVKEWYWDFGDGTNTLVTADGTSQVHTYAVPGTYTVKHVSRFSANCASDTANITITVYGKPVIGLDYPKDCLPVDGNVQFTSKSTAPGGQTLSYSWNFGDPSANATNPNTSTLADPVHRYAQGTYQVTYRITTDKGCFADSVFNATFNLKPVLVFPDPAIQPVCENAAGLLSVAMASVQNAVPGTGVYKGPGVSATGSFNPSTAGAGSHTVWYVYTTSAGCVDSVSSHVTVYAQPEATFTTAKDICIDQAVQLTDASAINTTNDPGSRLTKWTWSFGDGTPVVIKTTNAVVNHNYTTANTYTAQLVVESDKGCKSEPYTSTVGVHPLPVASFDLPQAICMPGGDALFTNTSTLAESASLSYQWSFGDGQTSTSKDATNKYAGKNNYTVGLQVKSAFGCEASTSKVLPLATFKDKPVAAFTVSADRICQGADNIFTDKSAGGGSAIAGWYWTFGDGTTSTDQNPVKRYGGFGVFDVRLQVTNADGCSSDPLPASQKQVTVIVQPVIDAGPSVNIAEGSIVTLQATAKNPEALRFQWSPASLLNNASVLRPDYRATRDQMFRLTATGGEGECSATDSVYIKILRPVKVPNVFSPNGDGINDKWMITNLADYSGCTVEVFNRYGQLVFSSRGYGTPWDGRSNGTPLPVGTYYYVIQLKNGFGKLTGSVTILR